MTRAHSLSNSDLFRAPFGHASGKSEQPEAGKQDRYHGKQTEGLSFALNREIKILNVIVQKEPLDPRACRRTPQSVDRGERLRNILPGQLDTHQSEQSGVDDVGRRANLPLDRIQ